MLPSRRSILRALFCAGAAAAAMQSTPAYGAEVKVYDYLRPVRYQPGDTMRDPHRNTDFIVRVRTPGGPWQDLYEHNVDVDWNNPQHASLVRFDFSGTVEVAVDMAYRQFSTVRVRPASAGIVPRIADGTAYFTIDRPLNLSVEFDGDKHHNLHVFAGAIDARTEAAAPAADVVVFGPGLHKPKDGARVFTFQSGQTVLIDGAAILEAGILLDNVNNVTIKGHGLIERPAADTRMNTDVGRDNSQASHIDGSAAIAIRHARNIRIEGLTVINPPGASLACMQSQQVRIADVKAFSAGPWADGIDIYSCQDVDIDRTFLRVADDCYALYNHRWDLHGDVRRVTVRNSTCWADVAHAMYMGLFGDKDKPEVTEDVTFKNIDVLEINESQPRYQGVMGIHANNATLVRNIRFEDIRVDHIIEGKLFNFTVIGDDRYSRSPGRGIEDIVLKNVSYTGQGVFRPSLLQGLDGERAIRGVTLENVTIGGKRITGPEPGWLQVGPHVSGVNYH